MQKMNGCKVGMLLGFWEIKSLFALLSGMSQLKHFIIISTLTELPHRAEIKY